MELVAIDLDRGEVCVRHDQALGIVSVVELGANPQAAARLGTGDEVDDDLMTDERASTPVHGDEREQTVLNLVPLAGARREVTDLNVQAGLLSESTQFEFPQAHAMLNADR